MSSVGRAVMLSRHRDVRNGLTAPDMRHPSLLALATVVVAPCVAAQAGRSQLMSAGDVDGDGVTELLPSGGYEAGAVLDGATLRRVRGHDVGTLGLVSGAMWNPTAAALGDLDGDRVGDYLLASSDAFMLSSTSGAAILSGHGGQRLWVETGNAMNRYPSGPGFDYLDGISGAGLGDADRDGTPDFALLGRESQVVVALSGRSPIERLWSVDLVQLLPRPDVYVREGRR